MSRLSTLLGQRLRRDWLQLTLWIAGTVALALAGLSGAAQTYGTEQERTALLATVMANPVILLFRGLPSGPGEQAFIVFLLMPFLVMMPAFMSTFLAVRHTRGDEEAGRLEPVAATTAGRTVPTVATIVHGVLANVVLGVLVAAAFLAAGSPAEGSWLAGFTAACGGLTYLGVALLAAQLMRTSRGANSLAVWVLVVTYFIAGIGNALGTPSDDLTHMRSSWLTWLSPFGWAENTRAFDENLWWPAFLCLAAFVVLAAVALALQTVRDLGASIVPERRGRAAASATLSTPTALVTRLATGSTIGWMAGAFFAGALSTSLGAVVNEMGSDNPAVADMLKALSAEADLEQAVIVVFFTMVGLLAACAGVQTVARARQEEAHGTAEPVLATPVQRVRWLADYVIVGFIAIVLTCAAAFVGAWAGAASLDNGAALTDDAFVAAWGQVIAASVFLVLTALVFTIAPRWTIPLGWTLVTAAIVFGLFGPLLGLPEWVTNLSPFSVAPVPSGSEVDLRGMWWLVLAVGVGAAASLTLMRRRELASAG
ncbi:ABC-2 type transport system permease protein [Microbacterium trichothecenolyticum]|uniref:ABC transporter permease n=1 Tax=Microbacterium trichothecenolyticum TaxID=69370 RepID=UPI00285EBD21|nr:polyketide antibiotic transporter [Microbacterium trichothecenolyticum]MDR7113204.1 ABC-2 type transport system permease protein [Microbacterium trichothecenolyticum]